MIFTEFSGALTHPRDAALATAEFGSLLFRTIVDGYQPRPIKVKHRKRDDVSSSGYYQDTLESALWAVGTTSTFEDAVIHAVNLGDDADTVGAVAGQLAGAIYGASAIPSRWLAALAWTKELESMALSLSGCE